MMRIGLYDRAKNAELTLNSSEVGRISRQTVDVAGTFGPLTTNIGSLRAPGLARS
jgi:hypothetical protein